MSTRADEQDLFISNLINVTKPLNSVDNDHIQGLYNWRNTYSNLNTYYINDVVEYNSSQYIRILENPGSQNPTDSSWKKLPGTNNDGKTVMSFTFRESGSRPYIDHNNNTPLLAQSILFEGSNNIGVPLSINFVASVGNSGSGIISIVNNSNATQICEISITSSNISIYDMGILSNISTDQEIWDIYISEGNSNRIRIYSMSVLFN